MPHREDRFAQFSPQERSILFQAEAAENLGRFRIDHLGVKLAATNILLNAWLEGAMDTATSRSDAERLGPLAEVIDQLGRVAQENFPLPELRKAD